MTTKTRNTYRELRAEVRTFWDDGDVYSSLMSWWFSLCDVLTDDGEDIPAEWHYRPGASGVSDSDFYAYGACARASADDLRRLGARFSRLYDRLEWQGRTY